MFSAAGPEVNFPFAFCILCGGIPACSCAAVRNVNGLLAAFINTGTAVEDQHIGVGGDIIGVVCSAESVVALEGHRNAGPCSILIIAYYIVDVSCAPTLVVGELDGSCRGRIGGLGSDDRIGDRCVRIINYGRIACVGVVCVESTAVDGGGEGVSRIGCALYAAIDDVGLVSFFGGGFTCVELGYAEVGNVKVNRGVLSLENVERSCYECDLAAVSCLERSKSEHGDVAAYAVISRLNVGVVGSAACKRHKACCALELEDCSVICQQPIGAEEIFFAVDEVGNGEGLSICIKSCIVICKEV